MYVMMRCFILCILFHYDVHSDNEMMYTVCNDALLLVCNNASFYTVHVIHYDVRSDNEMMCIVCSDALLYSM